MSDDLYRALHALREAPDPGAPELLPQWRVVMRAIDQFGRRVGSGVLTDRQEAWVMSLSKVHRHVRSLVATDGAGAHAWLERIYRRTYLDLVRARQRRRELFEHQGRQGDDSGPGMFDRMPAPEPRAPDPADEDPKLLAPYEDALFDRVDEHLDAHARRSARANARRNAELAYANIVQGVTPEELLERAGGEARRDTIYQWVRRGREDVLIPVLERWIAEVEERVQAEARAGGAMRAEDDDAGAELRFARTLLDLLRSRERRDAGQPRPGRRKGGGTEPEGTS